LKGIFVNVRVYETKQDREIIAKITDATNTQTPINYRDKISNKDFNQLTKTVFQNAGINYLTKRGEAFLREASAFNESVESETVLKFWFATFFEEPETAKNSIAVVLQKIFDATTFEQHPLEKLFDGHPDSSVYIQLLTAYYIYRFVQLKKRTELAQYEVLAYADEIMCYGIYKYIGINLDLYKQTTHLESAYADTLNILDVIVTNEKEAYTNAGKTFSFNAYFKKPKCKVDFNAQKGILENDGLVEDLKMIR
jgi:AIPR protein